MYKIKMKKLLYYNRSYNKNSQKIKKMIISQIISNKIKKILMRIFYKKGFKIQHKNMSLIIKVFYKKNQIKKIKKLYYNNKLKIFLLVILKQINIKSFI